MKTNLHSLFKTDESMELDGIWFDFGNGIEFRVRRMGGKNGAKVRKLTAQYHKPHAKMIQFGTLPEEKEREIYVKIFVESCLVEWKGVTDAEGKPVVFSRDNAVKLFMELPDLFDTLVEYASDSKPFKEELGNS